MSTHFRSLPTGTALRPKIHTDGSVKTAELDNSTPDHSVKTENLSPGSSLNQYDVTVSGSCISFERQMTASDPGLSSYANGSLAIPQLGPELSSSGGQSISESATSTVAQPGKPTRHSKNPSRHHIRPEIWERYKEEIYDVYIGQNRSLVELTQHMQGRGFKATSRMYKAKFAQWGFVKNNRKDDVAAMLRLQRQRGAVGKTTTFHRNGRLIDIETYMKRRGISSRELAQPTADGDLPDYLRASTPPLAEPRHMSLPSHLHAQEILLSSFRDLTSAWRDSPAAPARFEDDFNVYFDGRLCEATRDFSRACWFFSRGQTPLGSLLGQRAFFSLHLLVKQPSALGLFDLLVASAIAPNHGLAKELWRYLAGYAEATLGSSSTLCRAFTALAGVFKDNALETGVDFVFICMESIVEMLLETNDLAQTIAPSMCFFLLGDLILFNSTRTNLSSLRRAVSSASTSVSPQDTHHSPNVMRLIEPAAYLWQNGPYDEHSAELSYASLRIVDDVSKRYDWTRWVPWRVIAQFHRSRCGVDGSPAKENPRHALARDALERAVDAVEAGRGFSEPQIFEDMETLESWYREAGDLDQAHKMRRRREKALRDYFEVLQRSREAEIPRT
ncbi:hypothetical protein GGR52DRAFT_548430 [Hypoxylon sp. FL1284]|nr:hypothetical protein GGR52DRAFT_548430 [Hypoxylon sp. FL1284]